MVKETITERLWKRLHSEPSAVACQLVDASGSRETITVEALFSRALAYAAILPPASHGRELIGVCQYHGIDLLASFLGGIFAGHIPTMIPPPSPRMDAGKYASNFVHMMEHIRPTVMLTDAKVVEKLDGTLPSWCMAESRFILPGEVALTAQFVPVFGQPCDVAVIQHSSGTTGQQKGVALSHHAILFHNRVYSRRIGICETDVIVSWLPLYHDMGFIACFLLPLLEGIPFVQISPFDWVNRPVMLLEQIHQTKGTLCWMPNFAFSYLAKSVRSSQLGQELDLSTMRAWINCSEPVYDNSMREFVDRFHGNGVRDQQLAASYAMAENVFAVSQSLPGGLQTLSVSRTALRSGQVQILNEVEGSTRLVSNGAPIEGTEVRVVDSNETALDEAVVGEIQLRGKTLFSGYFRRTDVSSGAFTHDGWYRTGDLGFILSGDIYVTSRSKDVIIIQGRNFYPSDIEEMVGGLEGITRGRVVAVGIADERSGTDQLVILCEAAPSFVDQIGKLKLTVRQAVAQEFDCTPSDVCIYKERWLVKSTSGKLARKENLARYLAEKVIGKLN